MRQYTLYFSPKFGYFIRDMYMRGKEKVETRWRSSIAEVLTSPFVHHQSEDDEYEKYITLINFSSLETFAKDYPEYLI